MRSMVKSVLRGVMGAVDGLVDLLWPRTPGEPDRVGFGVKVAVLAVIVFLIVLGLLSFR